MLTAEARVATNRASRYLAQLCAHVDHIGRQHSHPARRHAGAGVQVQHAEYAETHGVLTFDGGLCTLDATTDALILRAQATDADTLQGIQEALAQRLTTIGRRDHLVVTW